MKIRNFADVKSLLFDNTSIKQTIFKNTFWLALASGVNKFLKLILFIYAARILGATEYGKFTFALAFLGLFIIWADLGLSQITTREFSREKAREKEFSAILSLKIILSLAVLVLALLGSFAITPDQIIQKVIWILLFTLLAGSFSQMIFAFLNARQKMEYQAFATIFEALVVTGAGLFILFYFPSVENLSYSYLFAALITLIFILIFFHFKIQSISLSWDKSIWKRFLKMSWPLALVGVSASIHNQIDSVMMGYLGQITQTGWYNAAYRIVAVTLGPLGLISTSFFPVLSSVFKQSQEKLQRVWNYYIEIIIFLSVPLIIGGITLAPGIIDFIYDSSYLPSVFVFQILIVMAGIIFLYTPFYNLLIVFEQQDRFFWAVLFGAIINVVLNLILIPRFSLYGAAFATVITHFLIFSLLLKFTLKFTSIRPFNSGLLLSFITAFLSSFLMYFVINQPKIFHLHVLYLIILGTGIYFICFYGFKKTIKYLKFV